ncbi:phage baseplate assembly protein V [Rahnella victoriana]|jgi:phage baseplate assembly protein V|uniref:Phage baseplate assembly protein V n=1 Tax=Rahnella victoriana TaxID=1510570 RepID=A0ABS0DXI7_9GAMM|nr:phage baseplate assembly protein V [Rahnella victoriana]MBF7958305.1 phage baseplate assembly protein V [Rahnella victoriana]
MNTTLQLNDMMRLVNNLVRIGKVSELDLANARCRVSTGDNVTAWLPWITHRAGRTRSWWAPSVGEQVLLLSMGGELNTAFVLPAVFSDASPAPSASADAIHLAFPDGAIFEYEPKTSALNVTGIKTAVINASQKVDVTAPEVRCTASTRITLDTPEVVCTSKLTTGSLEVKQGGTLTGNITHSGGSLISNGIIVHLHRHSGVQSGNGQTGGPQ